MTHRHQFWEWHWENMHMGAHGGYWNIDMCDDVRHRFSNKLNSFIKHWHRIQLYLFKMWPILFWDLCIPLELCVCHISWCLYTQCQCVCDKKWAIWAKLADSLPLRLWLLGCCYSGLYMPISALHLHMPATSWPCNHYFLMRDQSKLCIMGNKLEPISHIELY